MPGLFVVETRETVRIRSNRTAGRAGAGGTSGARRRTLAHNAPEHTEFLEPIGGRIQAKSAAGRDAPRSRTPRRREVPAGGRWTRARRPVTRPGVVGATDYPGTLADGAPRLRHARTRAPGQPGGRDR
ncbi:hypothetical protein GCM10009818_27890 [Nakamurella flavida]